MQKFKEERPISARVQAEQRRDMNVRDILGRATLPPYHAQEYQRRAEDCRKQADTMTVPEAKRRLLETADTWERMARWSEKNPDS